jgi:hypothetical protein
METASLAQRQRLSAPRRGRPIGKGAWPLAHASQTTEAVWPRASAPHISARRSLERTATRASTIESNGPAQYLFNPESSGSTSDRIQSKKKGNRSLSPSAPARRLSGVERCPHLFARSLAPRRGERLASSAQTGLVSEK